VGKTKHPVGLWATVISGTAVSAVLVSVALTQPAIDRFGDPTRYTSIYEQPQVEAWGAHPVDTFVDRQLASMTLEQKIRSLIIANQPGTDPAALQSFVSGNDLGGFIVMGSNVPESPGELAGITSAITGSAELPRLIGIDEEGGQIKRLPYDGYAGADTLRNEPVSSTLSAFTSRGELLTSVGVNLNFGVVADVSSDPQSFIYGRSFGGDPTASAERVVAAVQGEDSSVLSTIKHFPGHGSAPGDSHVGVPTSPLTFEQWLATDAVPFQAGIDAGSSMVMFGHLAFPAVDPLPSSLSPLWHKILREQLGFTGVIITDDMTMLEHSHLPEYENRANNAVLALAAGNDVLLYVPGADFDTGAIVSAVVAAVQSGQLSEADIDDSARRVMTLRRELYPGAESWVPPCDESCFIWVTY
jgi:beta-N-acetylhexosaminidase